MAGLRPREDGCRSSRTQTVRRRFLALVTLLLVESSGALYPTLTSRAGTLLAPDSACHQDTLHFQRALKNRTLWAARMMDASARVVVGGLWGARFQLGSFDACMSVGSVSPVGARYCLAALSAAPQPQPFAGDIPRDRRPAPSSCDDLPATWDHVTGLDPDLDARIALQGCGLAPGSIPLSDVLVALCVPTSCDAASLESALQASLRRGTGSSPSRYSRPHHGHPQMTVHVDAEHCVSHTEVEAAPRDTAASLFWWLFTALSVAVVLAPYLGWTALDWRSHLHALSLPEPPLAGLDLNVVAGIRAINMVLLVGVHRAFNTARLPTSNQLINTAESRTSPWHALGHHAALLVDTCFFMSGLLMSLSTTRNRGQPTLLRQLANRYLRLTPSLALVMLFYATAMESLGSGPLWKVTTGREATACRRWWWTNLLYVNNLVHGEQGEYSCMLQGWSLAVDMQQFVLGSLLLPVALPHLSGGRDWPLMAAGLVATALPFAATLQQGWPPMLVWSARALQNPFAEPMFYAFYVVTHMRAAPYIVGLAVGCVMLRIKAHGVVLSTSESIWLTVGSLCTMLAVLLSSALYGDLSQPPRPALEAALYASLSPALWAAAIGALIIGLTFGQHTAVVALLRWQPLVTVSRLSYGVYLVHFAIQLMQGGAERSPLHASPNTVIRSGFSDVIFSLIASLWLYVAVEAPVRHFAKKILTKKKEGEKNVDR